MIGVEELDALDLTIWLGRGRDAASRLSCNQSTISRRCQQCLDVFCLSLERGADGWPELDPSDLLQLERHVHQLHRLRSGRQLRLDASLLAAPLLQEGVPRGWLAGTLAGLGWKRPMQLLKARILDAWITAMGQELQADLSPWVHCIPLLNTPLQLACNRNHPLLNEAGLQFKDVAHLPRLAPSRGSYPCTERLLGPWRQTTPPLKLEASQRRRWPDAEPCRQQGVLHYGTRFSLAQHPLLKALPLDLSVQTELTLVIRRDISDQPALLALAELLQQRSLRAAHENLGVPACN